jgi:hypothetical protein
MVTCRQQIQSNPVAPISIAIAVVAPSGGYAPLAGGLSLDTGKASDVSYPAMN